ncbi:Periplasmic protein TonB (modular protein) [Magnetospirillum sp. LM-5]|uniref:cell division protein FtsL n=1 Tax=Magnetospirillum sp. LM-5 TaxID=2681466 RepID=UPI001381A361|nr:cell division protein FtsL [Magnetospirillum sp. LM-5]CAA7624681.1 Periplasmic protein TonB (modular protein) [Magnetospirillum sp. LM-5]
MIKGLGTSLLLAAIAGVLGVGLFFVKHEVRDQEARLAELNREIQRNQEEIHVLKAEWSYLNDPARLRQLSEKFLSMRVMAPSQITSLTPARKEPTATAALAAPKPAPVQMGKSEPGKSEPGRPAPKTDPVKPAATKPPPVMPPPPSVLAASPVPAPQPPRPAPQPPGRTIIIQSPALAQTPDGPGGLR